MIRAAHGSGTLMGLSFISRTVESIPFQHTRVFLPRVCGPSKVATSTCGLVHYQVDYFYSMEINSTQSYQEIDQVLSAFSEYKSLRTAVYGCASSTASSTSLLQKFADFCSLLL